MGKKFILFLLPGPVFNPELANFCRQYEYLSERYRGEILTRTASQNWDGYRCGNFTIRGFYHSSYGVIQKIRFFIFLIKAGFRLRKCGESVDVIIAFDPMFTGMAGLFLKTFLRVKLVTEINNSNFIDSFRYERGGAVVKKIKILSYKFISWFILRCSDGIKILTEKDHWVTKRKYLAKKVFSYHAYTPVEFFLEQQNSFNKTVFFVGTPFYRKGVDILIKAFRKIKDRHPDFKLVLMGHRLTEQKNLFEPLEDTIQFVKPVFYDELREYFLNCYCFVLPSREEGMGMVLLEAMASGKPVIGSNVGGIPGLIENGRNGFLFKSENIDDLADKLDKLLSNPEMARQMGEEGKCIVREKFSSQKYVEHFTNMIEAIYGSKF